MKIHRRNQQGVVLLVVVSLLVLFVLIGVTYAIVTSGYRRGARIVSRQKQLGVNPQQHLDSALYQIVRDTRSPASVIRGHSLLRDIYGTSVRGKVHFDAANIPPPVILQNNQFLRFHAIPLPQARVTPWNGQWNYTDNYYTGCVLTFTSGPLKGASTRVTGCQAQKAANGAIVLSFDVMLPKVNNLPGKGVEFVVNGHPFSGAGAGHNPGKSELTRQALQPNLLGDLGRTAVYLRGGANESYDAVDYQNMAMAAIIPQADTVIPSFHRPALIRYWQARDGWNLGLQRRTILRPMSWDHPNFTGSNDAPLLRNNPVQWAVTGRWSANADSSNNSWDVDNDNDGTPDSVWVDLGMPVQTDASGRKYKPLFAVLCVDMDGKLNLNAHGNYSHVLAGQQAPPAEVTLAGGFQSRGLRPSQGLGPAEISFRGACANQADYTLLLQNRYGRDNVPGKPGMDTLASAKLFEYQFSPQDLLGEVALGVDHYGQPIYETPFRNNGGKIVPASALALATDTPYEMNLSQPHQRGWSNIPGVSDTPYSVAELERVLRSRDADQRALPGRLRRLRNSNHLVTTDSYDLPVANGTDVNLALIRQRIGQLGFQLPPELMMGLRWNINQPFGNGRDDNNNGIIDEPAEASMETWLTTKFAFDHDNDGTTGKNDPFAGYEARQQYAQRLYCLMMAIKNPALLWDTDGNNQATKAETAERLAQWAVNAVDFRDHDSIMTAFQYDPKPLDGWNVDASSPVVWGCERPELLITETLAFHDRRTEDLDSETDGKKTTDGNNPDEDFDQRLRPRGSLFIELYNPWTGSAKAPNELYVNGNGVRLNGSPGGDPTWRMLIVKGNFRGTDPDTWKQRPADAKNNIERSVYFTKPDPQKQLPADISCRTYQPSFANPLHLVPGQYAVVGSLGQLAAANTYITPIGRRTDVPKIVPDRDTLLYGKTRHIQMTPSFAVNNNRAAGAPDKDPTSIQPVLSIPIDLLSISEPTTTPPYPVFTREEAQQEGGEGAYEKVRDVPFDDDRADGERPVSGNNLNYRHVYLQRLANPLLAWHVKTNPYRTIDSLSVDLTVFNGLNSQEPKVTVVAQMQTIERGNRPAQSPNKHRRNIWKREKSAWTGPETANIGKTDTHYVQPNTLNSLGFLNSKYGPAFHARNVAPPPFGKPASFYLGAPDTSGNRTAFASLAWNNRSFISPHELMLVPFSNQYQLLDRFNLSGSFGTDLYRAGNAGDFGHLLNFYDSATGLYRAFEFLQTPSRFVGTETVLNGAKFSPSQADGSSNLLHPPFNQVSSFRDPGKINLNTIFDSRIWNGLWNNDLNNELRVRDRGGNIAVRKFASNSIGWDSFVASRRGYGPNNGNVVATDNTKPSYFANPFRAVSSRNITGLPGNPIESTVLRSQQGSTLPLFSNRSTLPCNDARVNPSSRYQLLQRISNVTTTRSNVYAIWITVGYFEVEHVGPGNPLIYPDGYRLGAELGWDRGEIQRHRAFYMLDRSIPVAFEPGENHNVDKAILLRRFIE